MLIVDIIGASGYIAAHILKLLLRRGHSVTVTVRSDDKASKLRNALSIPHIDYRVVKDVAEPGAFDDALKIEGLEVVIHTASPFQLNINDVRKDLLDPAINGTKGILAAIKKNAPSVKKVIITSSFAAIVDMNKPLNDPSVIYTEKCWNSITEDQALMNPFFGYQASKTFAEKAAWDFVEREKPKFTLTTINPPYVFGPPVKNFSSLENVNTSNQIIRDLILGKYRNGNLDETPMLWVDVRDVAIAHIKAIELDKAANKRLFIATGSYTNREITEIIRKCFTEFAPLLPAPDMDHTDMKSFGYDNSMTTRILGKTLYTIDQSIIDTVQSLQPISARL